MPTDLPARTIAWTERAAEAESPRALLLFYFAIATFALVLVAGEAHFGMFNGMTTAQAVLRATTPDLRVEESAGTWLAVSP